MQHFMKSKDLPPDCEAEPFFPTLTDHLTTLGEAESVNIASHTSLNLTL